MALGNVKWFNAGNGYGFISPDDGENDIFVHISAVRKAGLETLTDGQRIEFELHQLGDGRILAEGVRLIESESD